ncbi:hypothetical protein BJX68DRAFT_267981 [Aspergillus pseudodeflectus]|uniref:Uncharacterized protein n=1 Tax=Aspergillus pseudodeflectus TaxID=176178 RepID=A0ABR4K6E2_9EURO
MAREPPFSYHEPPKSNRTATDLVREQHYLKNVPMLVQPFKTCTLPESTLTIDFHSPDLRSDNTQLCIWHMASRPVGDTRSLTCPDGKEVESFQQLWHEDSTSLSCERSWKISVARTIDPTLGAWVIDIGEAYLSAGDEPRVLLSMINHCLPSQDLFWAEVLLGIGVMLTRFKATSLKGCCVMAINALSCFKGYKACLLQAYMTEQGLVIMKSNLYDFYDVGVRSSRLQLFVSHFPSGLVGDTKSLVYPLPQ